MIMPFVCFDDDCPWHGSETDEDDHAITVVDKDSHAVYLIGKGYEFCC
jgi:hypothetical protein